MTSFETRTRELFDNGVKVGEDTVEVPVDEQRRAVILAYRDACQTLLGGTTGVQVKNFVRALNDVLRYLDSELS